MNMYICDICANYCEDYVYICIMFEAEMLKVTYIMICCACVFIFIYIYICPRIRLSLSLIRFLWHNYHIFAYFDNIN